MNILTAKQAVELINEIETGTGRYANRAPDVVVVTIDENGVAYICAKSDTNRLFAKADVRKFGRDLLAKCIG